jgi:hypothetical protein
VHSVVILEKKLACSFKWLRYTENGRSRCAADRNRPTLWNRTEAFDQICRTACSARFPLPYSPIHHYGRRNLPQMWHWNRKCTYTTQFVFAGPQYNFQLTKLRELYANLVINYRPMYRPFNRIYAPCIIGRVWLLNTSRPRILLGSHVIFQLD